MAAHIESSGWENNMKRVAVAAFSRWPLLARNFNWKISVNRNAHSRCLLMSGAVPRRYYCIYSVYVCMCVSIYIYIYIYIPQTHTQTYTHKQTHKYIYIYIYIKVCTIRNVEHNPFVYFQINHMQNKVPASHKTFKCLELSQNGIV